MLGRHDAIEPIYVHAGTRELRGSLGVPQGPVGLVVLAGTQSDWHVAEALRARGLATLTLDPADLLDPSADLDALASDLIALTEWARHSTVSHLPIGFLGADCFAAASVVAASRQPDIARAIVALDGRIDTAGPALATVAAPTLLICGLDEDALIERDREAIEQMTTTTQLAIIPGAFSDPTMSDEIIQLAAEWLVDHFAVALQEPPAKRGAWGRQFRDRRCAGERLAEIIGDRGASTIVFGLPPGGVVVAAEIARALHAPLDVWLVRKIGMPIQPELGMGALAEGAALLLDRRTVHWSGATPEDLRSIVHAKAAEIRRRATHYRGDAPPPDVHGKTVILVDDGIATGATLRAAIRGARKRGAARVIAAVPVAAAEAVSAIRAEADELVCIATPRHLISVGTWYQDFRPVPDSEVIAILRAARDAAAA